MGARGPAPKPSQLKLIQGTYRADRAPASEPTPKAKIPSCPSWLHREAKREWRRISKHLVQLGLLTEVDRAALAAYCQAYAEWWEMEREIKANGRVQITPTGYVAHRPEVSIRNKALETMNKFLVQFGMSPSSRTRISVDDAAKDPDDAFFGY